MHGVPVPRRHPGLVAFTWSTFGFFGIWSLIVRVALDLSSSPSIFCYHFVNTLDLASRDQEGDLDI